MRTIKRSSAFKRDYKRAARGPHGRILDDALAHVLRALLNDEALEARNRDHELIGDWAGYLECHVRPDLLLIYPKPDKATLRLARLGSHSELFG